MSYIFAAEFESSYLFLLDLGLLRRDDALDTDEVVVVQESVGLVELLLLFLFFLREVAAFDLFLLVLVLAQGLVLLVGGVGGFWLLRLFSFTHLRINN